MASLIARRLARNSKNFLGINPIFYNTIQKSSYPSYFPNPDPKLLNFFSAASLNRGLPATGTIITNKNNNPLPPGLRRLFSTPSTGSDKESAAFKHQEIEGPTVERDLSPLANETREVTQGLMNNMYRLGNALALMSLVQLGLGAWVSYATRNSPMTMEVSMMNAVAFGFSISMALAIRRSLKPMIFLRKMEGLGRLRILTCNMQVVKHLSVFFLRIRGVSYLCIAGLSLGSLFSVLLR